MFKYVLEQQIFFYKQGQIGVLEAQNCFALSELQTH